MTGGAAFVFVNKNARSKLLTRSEGEERKSILSHAQQRRACGTFVVLTSATFQPPTTIPDPPSGSRLRCKTKPVAPHLTIHDVAQSQFDPFQSLSVVMTKEMQDMLGYYIRDIVGSIYPVSYVATGARQHIVRATECPSVLHALLAVANASVFALVGHDSYLRRSHKFRHKAMTDVRKSLSKGAHVSAATAYAVAQLLRIECSQGEESVAKIHFDGLVKMMNMIGSPCDIPFPLRFGVQASLYYCSAMTRTCPPDFLPSWGTKRKMDMLRGEYNPRGNCISPSSPERENPILRFSLPAYKAFIGETLSDVIARSTNIKVQEQSTSNEAPSSLLSCTEALTSQSLDLEYRLLSMPFETRASASKSNLGNAQNVIRLTLYVLSIPPIAISQPRSPFRVSMARQFMTALQDSDLSNLWEPYPDLLLWTLFTAASVSYQQAGWTWIIRQAALVCARLDIVDLVTLEKTLLTFNINTKRFGQLSQRIWESIQMVEITGKV